MWSVMPRALHFIPGSASHYPCVLWAGCSTSPCLSFFTCKTGGDFVPHFIHRLALEYGCHDRARLCKLHPSTLLHQPEVKGASRAAAFLFLWSCWQETWYPQRMGSFYFMKTVSFTDTSLRARTSHRTVELEGVPVPGVGTQLPALCRIGCISHTPQSLALHQDFRAWTTWELALPNLHFSPSVLAFGGNNTFEKSLAT